MTEPKDTKLDAFFAAARQDTIDPSPDLMARVLADAAALQPAARGITPARADVPGFWSNLLDMLGGWPAVSGVAAAGVAGLWLGVAPPASVEDLTSGLWGTTTSVSLVSDYDALFGEALDG